MSNISDRAYFLEAVKNNPMTISEIKEKWGCADSTARAWVRHNSVEMINGSYPPAYVYKDTLILGTQSSKSTEVRDASKAGKVSVVLDVPPEEEVEKFFRQIMADKGGTLNFVPEFRAAESQKDIRYIIHKLKSAIVVSEYYLALMQKDGMP